MAADLPGLGGGWTLVVAPDLELEGSGEALAGAFGRGGVRRLGSVVLRPYRRGGLVRHLNARIYLSPARFIREFQVHRALWLAGFPTVEPLGYALRRRGWGVEGVYLTRHEACEPWPRRWDAPVEPLRPLLESLCAWGLYAPDLNATNVMVAPEGGLLILDWDRAAWRSGDLFPRYQARLLRSLEKLGAPGALIRAVRAWQEKA